MISANYFEANEAYQYGGGINVTHAAPLISGNTISSNTAYYGGAWIFPRSPEFTKNIVTGNMANVHGGGVYCATGRRRLSSPIAS